VNCCAATRLRSRWAPAPRHRDSSASPLVDAVTGSVPAMPTSIARSFYVMFARVEHADALTFFSMARAEWALASGSCCSRVGALRASERIASNAVSSRRAARPGRGAGARDAAVLLPRPVPRLTTADDAGTVIDYHAHTSASHDWAPRVDARETRRLAFAPGLEATYVRTTRRVRRVTGPPPGMSISLLPASSGAYTAAKHVCDRARPSRCP